MINVNQLFAAQQNTDIKPADRANSTFTPLNVAPVNTGARDQFSQLFNQQRIESPPSASSTPVNGFADRSKDEVQPRSAQAQSSLTDRSSSRVDSGRDNSAPAASDNRPTEPTNASSSPSSERQFKTSDEVSSQHNAHQTHSEDGEQAVQQQIEPNDRRSTESADKIGKEPMAPNASGTEPGSTAKSASVDAVNSISDEATSPSAEETDWVAFVDKNIELNETLALSGGLATANDEQQLSVTQLHHNLGLSSDTVEVLESTDMTALTWHDLAPDAALKTDLLAALESLGVTQLAAGSIDVSEQLPALTELEGMTSEQLLASLDSLVVQLSEWQAQMSEGDPTNAAQLSQRLLELQELLTQLNADTDIPDQLNQRMQRLNDKLSNVIGLIDGGIAAQRAAIDTVSGGLGQSAKEGTGSADHRTSQNLAQWSVEWNDAQQQQYLERLKESVSAVVPGLNNDSKGSEFIVALQAGLEEVKKQAKLGREPGMDLQALVQNALEQVEQPITKGQLESLQKVLTGQQQTPNLAASLQQQIEKIQSVMVPDGRNDLPKLEATQGVEQRAGAATLTGVNNNQSPLDKAINLAKPEGQQQLMEKVRWMMNSRNMAAEIQLDPADLGAMQIRIALNGDVASVNFTVQNNQTRDLLAQAQSQLQSMLAEQGLSLGQSHVNQESQGKADGGGREHGGSSSDTLLADDISEHGATEIIEQSISGGTIGGINVYA